jgi:hypothetical protein
MLLFTFNIKHKYFFNIHVSEFKSEIIYIFEEYLYLILDVNNIRIISSKLLKFHPL